MNKKYTANYAKEAVLSALLLIAAALLNVSTTT